MPVTLASCLGLTSDAPGICPHDYGLEFHLQAGFEDAVIVMGTGAWG